MAYFDISVAVGMSRIEDVDIFIHIPYINAGSEANDWCDCDAQKE